MNDQATAAFGEAAGNLLRAMLQRIESEDAGTAAALTKALRAGSWLTLEASASLAGVSTCKLLVCAPSGERVGLCEVGFETEH